jgi:uncharacterized membrane protein
MMPEIQGGGPSQNENAPNPENLGLSGRNRHQLSATELAAMETKVRKVEIAISLVLRIGVIASVVVIGVGLGIMFYHHAGYSAFSGHVSYKGLTSQHTVFPHSFASLGHSIARGDGSGIVVAGVLLLILTPVARVAVGVLSFLYEKDIPMALITLFVLCVLIASFFLAHA